MESRRTIEINAPFDEVIGFLVKIENLPKWTLFFKECLKIQEDGAVMSTLLGKCHTRCNHVTEGNSAEIRICSEFEHGNEVAVLLIEPVEWAVSVTFCLHTPEEVSVDKRKRMLTSLEEELKVLQSLIEKKDE